jgi:hypothetical protein
MKYQLVLQMPAAGLSGYDEMIRLEDALAEKLGDLASVDGHDAGSAEMNIFLFTDEPAAAFDRIKPLAEDRGLLANLVAAYRNTDGEEYVVLYPPGRTHFAVA